MRWERSDPIRNHLRFRFRLRSGFEGGWRRHLNHRLRCALWCHLSGRLGCRLWFGSWRSLGRHWCGWCHCGRDPVDADAAFEPIEPRGDTGVGGVGRRDQHPRTHEFEQEPWGGGTAELDQRLVDDVGGPSEFGTTEATGLLGQPLAEVVGCIEKSGRQRVRDRLDDDEVTQALQQVFGEAARILAGLDHLVDDAEDGGSVVRCERVDGFVEQRIRRVAEQLDGEVIGDAFGSGTAEQLVEDAEGVADRSGPGAHHERQRGGLERDTLLLAEREQVVAEQFRRHQPERVVVRTRPDGADDLVGFGGGEDEPDVRRWLFDQLQQRIERCRRDHVGLIDDVDLVATVDRGEERALTQVAGFFDIAVAGGIHLDDVDAAGAAAGEVAATLALTAGIGDGRPLAIEGAGEDARARRLAAAARAGEQVGVVDLVGRQRMPQRGGDVVLPDDFGERLRPVPAVQRQWRLRPPGVVGYQGFVHVRNPTGARRHPTPFPRGGQWRRPASISARRASRWARRISASRERRSSSSSVRSSGGISRARPSASIATNTRYADATWIR